MGQIQDFGCIEQYCFICKSVVYSYYTEQNKTLNTIIPGNQNECHFSTGENILLNHTVEEINQKQFSSFKMEPLCAILKNGLYIGQQLGSQIFNSADLKVQITVDNVSKQSMLDQFPLYNAYIINQTKYSRGEFNSYFQATDHICQVDIGSFDYDQVNAFQNLSDVCQGKWLSKSYVIEKENVVYSINLTFNK
ncbi:Hypothetical_protein [Hexamita inflata]|uniref:Hypothetical_protein n=1 Tax=Hexamita inflata TaxID=28002 RepID=A0AA86UX99_9EUKA|nr:Hypothetical protein HINF_LOCUS55906 [Hexamita inflata]